MSTNIKKIVLDNSLTPQTQLNLSGVIMGDDLKDTIKINSMRVNKNTNEYYTLTLIVFNYVRYVNNTQLLGVTNKKEYLRVAKTLLNEINECGLFIGDEWRDNNKLPYSKGNSKLSKDTVIINLSPSSLCISSNNGMCDVCGICYALESERRYINSLIFRLTQMVRFNELSIEEITSQFMRLRVFKWLRINESGDLMDEEDLIKLSLISRELWDKKGVRSYLYTHREDLWDLKSKYQTNYFKINRSGIDFKSLPSIKSNHNTLYCDGLCKYCIYCKMELLTPISILYHGIKDGIDERDTKTKKRDLILKWECFKMFESGCDESEIISHIQSTLNLKGGF